MYKIINKNKKAKVFQTEKKKNYLGAELFRYEQ